MVKRAQPRFGRGFKVTVARSWAGRVADVRTLEDPQFLRKLQQRGTRVTITGG